MIDTITQFRDCKKPNGVKLICATDMEPRAVAWLWKNWLAMSKLHILAGAPGTGKTTIALNLAAIISHGGQWPDGIQCESPGNVLIWSGEDDPHDTLLPRLLMHNADQKRIYFISDVINNNTTRAFDPACDIPKLYEKAAEMGEVRLIIIDPIVNAVAGDSHKNGEVRRSLQPLVELGEKLKAVILGISHFSKGTLARDPLERVTGSIAFGALARVVLATAKMTDPNGQEKRVLVRTKSNHGLDGGGYNYHIEQRELEGYPGVFSSQIIWGEALEGSARELLTDPNETRMLKEHPALSEAVDFLKMLLSDGLVDSTIVIQKAKEAGINYSTIQRAKTLLEIEAIHEGFGKGSVWQWRLPSKMINKPKDDRLGRVNTVKKDDQLLDLAQRHPAMVEGCKLSDILLHAIPEDYEDLKDPAVLGCLARWLKKTGKIKVYN
jgi:putative DNA primase/helicase